MFCRFEPLVMHWAQVRENAGPGMIGIAIASVVLISSLFFFPLLAWVICNGNLLSSMTASAFSGWKNIQVAQPGRSASLVSDCALSTD